MFRALIDWLLGRNHRPSNTQQPTWEPPRSTKSEMDQGDYHSGPEGYTPNTSYPETQYGSNFDEDAAWNEGDWQ